MLKKIKSFILDVADIYFGKRVTRGAAALSYYLTMTIFPLLICLYSMLGTQYKQAMQALDIIQGLMAEETYNALADFLTYVSANSSRAMLVAAIMVLITSASAAFRSFQLTLGEIQGEIRFRGIFGTLVSVVFAVVFLAAAYVAILLVMTGSWFIEFLRKWLPFATISSSWTWLRFILLFGVVYLMIVMLYLVTVPWNRRYRVSIGALTATAALVAVSILFSLVIGASAKYPLVYGSLASFILLMFWLYICSLVFIMGDVINIVIRDRKQKSDSRNKLQ